MLKNSQRRFWALDTSHPEIYPAADEEANHLHLDLDVAEADGVLDSLGSVFSPPDNAVYDGVNREGVRMVTFAHILKHKTFPLAEILRLLLELGEQGTASPVEIEFAVDLCAQPMEFGFLQIRPIILHEEYEDVRLDSIDRGATICYTDRALGNGRMRGVQDIVYVKPETFDSSFTREIAAEIGKINEQLRQQGKTAVMIGPGRWGTADRWLGIPVSWDQISSAQLIVETSLRDFMITPSQGTHFFQNLTSLGIGYFTVDPNIQQGWIDWPWLDSQPAATETAFVRHVHLADPLEIRLDGRTQRGAILKPNGEQ